MYVVIFDTDLYWCGNNQVSSQLRKAKIYTSLKKAIEAANDALRRYSYTSKLDTKNASVATSFRILEVQLSIVGVVQ